MGINLYSVNLTNTLKQRQNGRHFEEDIFKPNFVYGNCCFPVIYFPEVPIGLNDAFAAARRQSIIWQVITQFTDVYVCHSASVIKCAYGLLVICLIAMMLSCWSDSCDLFSIFPCFVRCQWLYEKIVPVWPAQWSQLMDTRDWYLAITKPRKRKPSDKILGCISFIV